MRKFVIALAAVFLMGATCRPDRKPDEKPFVNATPTHGQRNTATPVDDGFRYGRFARDSTGLMREFAFAMTPGYRDQTTIFPVGISDRHPDRYLSGIHGFG